MTDVWLTIALLTVTTVVIRGAGPIAMGGRELGRRTEAVIELLAPALLAALIVVETVGGPDGGLDPDARIAGVAAPVGPEQEAGCHQEHDGAQHGLDDVA